MSTELTTNNSFVSAEEQKTTDVTDLPPATTKKTRGRPRVANAYENRLEYSKEYQQNHKEQANSNAQKYSAKCTASYKLMRQFFADQTIVNAIKTNADLWQQFEKLCSKN